MRRAVVLAALAASPAAAGEDRNGPWYAANPQARAEMLRLCETDPGRLHLHPDCVNARNGDIRALVQQLEALTRGEPHSPAAVTPPAPPPRAVPRAAPRPRGGGAAPPGGSGPSPAVRRTRA